MKEYFGEIKFSYPKIKEVNLEDIPLPCIITPKFDGELTFLFYQDGWKTVNAWGHYRTDYPITRDAEILDKTQVYVGELYCGKNLYDLLRNKKKPEFLRLVIFDILDNPSSRNKNYLEKIESLPLQAKWDLNSGYLTKIPHCVATQFHELKDFFNIVVFSREFEGIVCRSINIDSMWKVKKKRTIDAVVMGISKDGKSFQEKKISSLLVGLYYNGVLWKVGRVGSGFSPKEREELFSLLLNGKINDDKDYIYIKPKIVIEIEANEFVESKEYDFALTFRCPRFVRWRLDKRPEDCQVHHQCPELLGMLRQ